MYSKSIFHFKGTLLYINSLAYFLPVGISVSLANFVKIDTIRGLFSYLIY